MKQNIMQKLIIKQTKNVLKNVMKINLVLLIMIMDLN